MRSVGGMLYDAKNLYPTSLPAIVPSSALTVSLKSFHACRRAFAALDVRAIKLRGAAREAAEAVAPYAHRVMAVAHPLLEDGSPETWAAGATTW